MNQYQQYLKSIAVSIITFGVFVFSFNVIAATPWQGPTATPPDNNVDAPIHSGSLDQIKEGSLEVQGGITTNALNGVNVASNGAQLDFSGSINGIDGLCINGDCRTVWPTGATTLGPEVNLPIGQGTFRCASGSVVTGVIKDNSGDSHIRHLKCRELQ